MLRFLQDFEKLERDKMSEKFIQEYQPNLKHGPGNEETAKIIYSTRRESHRKRERKVDKSATPFSRIKGIYRHEEKLIQRRDII